MSAPVHKGIMESVKDTLVGSIKGTGEIVTTVVDTVSGTLVSTIKGTGAVGTALTSTVSDILRGAITGTAQVSGDLGHQGGWSRGRWHGRHERARARQVCRYVMVK